MCAKKKNDSKTVTQQKRNRRKVLTTYRICRYGLESFVRNSWLSIAATAVMTVTLTIVFVSVASQNILTDTIAQLRDKVSMSIYLKTDTSDKDGKTLVTEVKKLSSVRDAEYVSAATARAQIAKENSGNDSVLEAINEATNKTPATLKVTVMDINNTTQLQDFVKNNGLVKKHINTEYKPSFAGERRDTIEAIGRAVSFAQKTGIVAGTVFVVISSLIIFNTIRMAIYNRREEIQMMKLIGADHFFIRGPFLIESVVYGLIAAIIATALGIFGLYKSAGVLLSYQVSAQPTIDFAIRYAALVVFGMMALGATIGIVSSLLATRRYLKL
jgi:cell division transport system permease protein